MSSRPNKTALAKRTEHPHTLAGALGGLMTVIGVRASDADLAMRWGEIMGGEIAAVAQLAAVKKLRDGKYSIAVRPVNPAFALQLSYRSDEITRRLNNYFGRDAVSKITFRK